MKKKYNCLFILITFLYGSNFIKAQQITPVVVNSTGGTQTAAAGVLNFNVGESAVSTISNGSYSISQGFLQPDAQNTLSVKSIDKAGNQWTVHPNPATDYLIISSENYKEAFWIKVIDNMGKEVLYADVIGNRISLSGINAGIYRLIILSNQKEIIATRTITKVN